MVGLLLSSNSRVVGRDLRVRDKRIGYGTGAAWNRKTLALEGE